MDTRTKLLVVDDDPDLLQLLKLRLDAGGYEALTAENAEAGLALLATVRPQAVITDLRMPGMDGIWPCSNRSAPSARASPSSS